MEALTPKAMGMIRCADCAWLTQPAGACGVAEQRKALARREPAKVRGEFPRWTYRPVTDLWRRCGYGKQVTG